MDDLTCTDFMRTLARTTGARIYANSRLPDQYPVGTALHARVEEEVARDIKEFAEVCARTLPSQVFQSERAQDAK